MNNLPSNLTRHTVFRDNDYSHTLVFPDSWVLPAVEDMAMQVRKNGVIVEGVSATIAKDGQRVTFTYTKETLALIPGYHFQYFLIDGQSILGGELMVIIGVGEQDVTESVIEITEEGVTVVVVQGLALVEAQVALAAGYAADALASAGTAEAYSANAADFATQASTSKDAAATSATNAGTSAGQADTSASNAASSATAAQTAETNAETAQAAAEAARNTAVDNATQTTEDRVQTGIDAASALASKDSSAISEINALAAKVAAESARDASLIQAGVYTTEAAGRAAVADGQAFKVQGSGDVAAYEYRRTNSTTSVLIATYPSSAAVLAIKLLPVSGTSFPDVGFYAPTGVYNNSANWRSVTVLVESGSLTYHVFSLLGASLVTFFNSSNVKISSVDGAGGALSFHDGTVTVPAGTVKAVISAHVSGVATSTYSYQVETTKRVLQNSTDIGNKQDKVVQRTISVSKTGTPSSTVFNTIAAALAVWTAGTQILIFDGIYEEISLAIPDGAYLKGVGSVEIRGYLPVTSTTVDVDAKSTLDFPNSGTLENLTITAKNMRYPIHSDFGVANVVQNVINCRIIHYGNKEIYDYRVANAIASPNDAASVWRACSAWGAGTSAGSKIYLKNCYIESQFRAFSTHNNANYNLTSGASLVQCDNCDIVSFGIDRDGTSVSFAPSIFIQSLASNTDDVAVFNNCRINGFLVLQSSTADWREFTQRVQGSGNNHLIQVRNVAGGAKLMSSQITTQSVFVIRVRSASASDITVSGNLTTSIFGNYSKLKGSIGLNSWIKAQVNANTAYASVNSYSGAKTISFVSGADTKNLTLSTTYTTAAQLVSDMNTQFGGSSFVADLYWLGFDWYPNFTNEIASLKNSGTTAILRGRAVKKSGFSAISPMTSADAANTFYGIAVQDIPVGMMGDVKYAGYMLRIWVDGLFATTLADNDLIKVNSDGSLSKSADGSGVIVSSCISNENITINTL